jgi:hypothetical protein
MERSTRINNCLFGKTRFWQGFPGVNRLKTHKTARIRANASGSLQTTLSKLPTAKSCGSLPFCHRGSSDRDLTLLGRNRSNRGKIACTVILVSGVL